MNATLSTRQIRLVALLVLLVVAGGGFLVVTKHKSPTSTTRTTANSTPTRTTHATTTPTPSKTHKVTPVKLHTHGLPVSIARALQKHSVVVVSVTTPRGEADALTRSEAQVGAAQAGVGYVAINAFHQRPGTAILRKLGVVDTPEILVVRRPGTITSQFKGFVDRDVVAQAVADAR
jgi:thiol:disulfide interchange protein